MNKTDKKELDEALNLIGDAKNAIENFTENYHCKLDDLSEKAKEGERGQAMHEQASELPLLVEMLDEAIAIGNSLVA